MAFSKNGWSTFNEIEFEYKKTHFICDSFDNLHLINKHYQKTILEQYNLVKQKQEAEIKKHSQENVKEGSTFLYFSTTNDHESSNSKSNLDDSINSINYNHKDSLDQILLPESLICFKIIDIFSIQSEKTHEFLTCNWGIMNNNINKMNNEETERIFIRGVPITTFDEETLRDIKKNSSFVFLLKIKYYFF